MIENTDVDPCERILRAAADLLASGGREAVSTRAVCAAAGVQSPAIYRHYRDMRELLGAAASRSFETYLLTKKTQPRSEDAVDDLRRGWDLHVGFGLAHPAVYAVLYGDLRPETETQAVRDASGVLHELVQRVAQEGRLRLSVQEAARMLHSAAVGVTLDILAMPVASRDLGTSDRMRETILSAITAGSQIPQDEHEIEVVRRWAVALKAVLDKPAALTCSEAALLSDWLDRLSSGPAGGHTRR